jgi:hypothetical protein
MSLPFGQFVGPLEHELKPMAFLSSFCTLEMIPPRAQIPAGIYIIFSGVLHARNPSPKYLMWLNFEVSCSSEAFLEVHV